MNLRSGLRWSWLLAASVLGACAGQDDDKHPVLVGGILVFIVIGLPALYVASRVRGERQRLHGGAADLGITQVRTAGAYVSGHPDRDELCTLTNVGIDERNFVFVNHVGELLFRIPRDAPSAIDVVDATKVTETTMQKVTVGRVALLGIYALAFPKTTTTTKTVEKYVVGVTWKYNGTLEVTTCFAFTAASEANGFAGFVAKQTSAPIARSAPAG